MSSFKIFKQSETETAQISLCNDGIMRVMLKKGSEIDLPKSQENIKAYIEMIERKKYAFLIYPEDDTIVYTEEARKNAKINEKLFVKTCVAVIVKSLAHRIIANFYFNFHKPGYPFKVFDKMKDAEAWCLEQIEKENRPKRAVSSNSVLV